jgi:hypothetical protein
VGRVISNECRAGILPAENASILQFYPTKGEEMIQKLDQSSGNVIGYKISGTVSKSDYQELVPEVESLVQQEGNIRLLLDLTEFKGEKVSAWGADFKFGRDYRKKIDKLAIVGDKKWEKWMAKLSEPFFAHESEFFHSDNNEDAWTWLQQ